MDAVLTCMVDEKIGPGDINAKLISQVKEFIKCDGAIALRSPSIALDYALRALDLEKGKKVMISALAPSWQYVALESFGYEPLVLDVQQENALVSLDSVKKGIEQGAALLLLHETEGILPDLKGLKELGIPIIEDISQSAGASFSISQGDSSSDDVVKVKAGQFGVFTILGLEEKDVLTAGGGAILFATNRRDWSVLKKYADSAPLTDLLPDINAALAWVQFKEFNRNELVRKELFSMYQHACLMGKHKMLSREMDEGSTVSSFPLVLSGSFKDVKQYAAKKDIEVQLAFENSVIAMHDEFDQSCIHAKSLYLRCIHVPLYSRLTHAESAKIVKVLTTLP